MSVPEKITQTDRDVWLQIEVPDSVRRHLKAEAARLGKKMGEYITHVLETYTGYVPPASKPEVTNAVR